MHFSSLVVAVEEETTSTVVLVAVSSDKMLQVVVLDMVETFCLVAIKVEDTNAVSGGDRWWLLMLERVLDPVVKSAVVLGMTPMGVLTQIVLNLGTPMIHFEWGGAGATPGSTTGSDGVVYLRSRYR